MEFVAFFSQGTAKRRLSTESVNDPKRHAGDKSGEYAKLRCFMHFGRSNITAKFRFE